MRRPTVLPARYNSWWVVNKSSHLADTSDPLIREALDWVIRLRSGEATVADAAAFRQWRARSPAHTVALREALRLWRAIGPAAQELRQEIAETSSGAAAGLAWRHPGSPALDRRAVLAGLAAAATAYVIVRPPFALWPSLHELGADYRTAKGERRRIVLGDNVVLHLNTQTSIAVASGA